MSANLRGLSIRQRILDVAQDAVLAKGFEATSIDEIVVAVAITKSGFSCHFPDKNALAHALIDRYINEENHIFDSLFGRARDLTDDPLRAMLVGLKLLPELLGNIPGGHPECLVGTACYQERLFDREVREINRMAKPGWRKRFSAMFREIIETRPPKIDVDPDELGDMLSVVCECAIIVGKAAKDPGIVPAQVLHFRRYVRLIFDD